jgi:hypothetical protein
MCSTATASPGTISSTQSPKSRAAGLSSSRPLKSKRGANYFFAAFFDFFFFFMLAMIVIPLF